MTRKRTPLNGNTRLKFASLNFRVNGFTHPSFTHPSFSIVFNYSFLLAMLICVAAVSQHRNWNIHRQTIQYSCFWCPGLPRSVLIQRLSASPSPRGKSLHRSPASFQTSFLQFKISKLEIPRLEQNTKNTNHVG